MLMQMKVRAVYIYIFIYFFQTRSVLVWDLSLVTDEYLTAKCETPPFQSDTAPFPVSRGNIAFSPPSPMGAMYKIIGREMNYLSVVVSSIPALGLRAISTEFTPHPCVGQSSTKNF